MTGRRIRFAVIALNLVILSAQASAIFAEKLVGLQSAPSIAMALPWFAEEARLYPKYDLDFQLVYIASSGIVTAAMSGGNGSVAIVGGEGPIRAFLSGNTDFVFIGSVKNVLTHSIMGKPEIKRPEDLKGRKVGVGRIGGNSHYFAAYGMRQKGMDLARDTNFIQTGGAPETFLALTTGAVDAASLTTPQDTRAAFLGLQLRHRRQRIEAPLRGDWLRDVALGHRQAAQGGQPIHAHDGGVAKNHGDGSRFGFSTDGQKNRSHRPKGFRRRLHRGVESARAAPGN